ncbi:VPS9 domain-containing protein 1 [Colossoma macropomum]|uniref:VPS9 domain-containing protein 1 n=1 Tax=Colossoma macropomum TaxID=42526 RepID=UPI001863FEF2|nr:VPS9 domain-containing protein 1 [Colossoma macropomum]XP_036441097.1 VPS9 domain-containing protein 1 [Colossoma macropomum]
MASVIDSGQRPLQNAMRLVSVAIQLDTGNRHKEAYCEYLKSINYISHALLQDAACKAEGEMEDLEVEKMVKLAEQCLERVKSCIGKRNDASDPDSSAAMFHGTPLTQTTAHVSNVVVSPTKSVISNETAMESKTQSKSSSIVQLSRHRRVLSEGEGAGCPFLPPEVFQKLQTVDSQDSKKELTPIEEASRLNQKLKANYEARLARLAPSQATQKTSLTLSLQRQMMENLIIARARQDALQRKMEERRLRLQEQANRRFSSSGTMTPEEQEQRVLYANILEYEQDNDWPKVWKANLKKKPNDATLVSGLVTCLLSCPEHPVMKLLKKLQYQVYNKLYPMVSQIVPSSPLPGCSVSLKPSRSAQSLLLTDSPKGQLKSGLVHSLSDASISLSLVHDLNATDTGPELDSEEPMTPAPPDRENSFEDLEQFLNQLDWIPSHSADDTASDVTCDSTHGDLEVHIQDLEERALKEHLKAIIKDIHNAIDRLLSLCLLSFECLNTASAKDHCVACIEEVFFTPIWSPLLALFRRVHRERELAFENSVQLYRNASPGDMGVASKLYPKNSAVLHGSYPYESAVQELKLLCRDYWPQRKLECIVRTLRLICACAEHYRLLQENDPSPKTAAIGADDLLPILSFVALRTELPQLVSECAALEEFIHEGYLIGEEGYCLTSMQSALTYVESLHLVGTSQQAAKPT